MMTNVNNLKSFDLNKTTFTDCFIEIANPDDPASIVDDIINNAGTLDIYINDIE